MCVCGDRGQDVLCVMGTDRPAGGCGSWVSSLWFCIFSTKSIIFSDPSGVCSCLSPTVCSDRFPHRVLENGWIDEWVIYLNVAKNVFTASDSFKHE